MGMIRSAESSDLSRIMEIVSDARTIMRGSGNMRQWTAGYPSENIIDEDIKNGFGRIVIQDGDVVGYFAFIHSPEPTYGKIFGGKWTDEDSPYYVIHRIASTQSSHGVLKTILDYGFSQCDNIRVDTHKDNLIMRKLLSVNGFTYCGIIYLASGDERLAYQKTI
ncbi:MAG: N-acetyltransferase [Bacteroidales bacterium]